MKKIQVIAHRGMGQGVVQPDAPPENTLPAFKAGWETGADGCELDVHVTADGEVIVIHDSTTHRTTNHSATVADLTAAELQALDAGRWKSLRWAGTRVPLLSEVLAILPDGKSLYIELKDGPQVVAPAAEVVRASGKGPSQIVFISFDVDTIGAMKQAMPGYDCLLVVVFEADYNYGRWKVLYDEGPGFRTVTQVYDEDALLALVKHYGLDGIDSSFVLPRGLVGRLHDAGMKVVVWTVNDPTIAKEMVDIGITTITTDRPGPIVAALGART